MNYTYFMSVQLNNSEYMKYVFFFYMVYEKNGCIIV